MMEVVDGRSNRASRTSKGRGTVVSQTWVGGWAELSGGTARTPCGQRDAMVACRPSGGRIDVAKQDRDQVGVGECH